DFPRLADHSQADDRLLRGELRAPAVDRLDLSFFQLAKPVKNVIEIGEHQAEENPPHEISETSEPDQRSGQVEELAGLRFVLASLVEHAAMQQFVKRAAAAGGIERAVQSVQPHRRL